MTAEEIINTADDMTIEEIINAVDNLLPSERLEVAEKVISSLLGTIGESQDGAPDRITEDWRHNEECIMTELANLTGLVDFVYSHLREKLLFL